MTVPNYVTAAEVRAQSPSIPSSADTLLGTLATAASRLIDRYCKLPPGSFASDTDVVQYYDGSGCLEQWIDPLAALPTTVQVAETGQGDSAAGNDGVYVTWSRSDYFIWPKNALTDLVPIKRLDINLLFGTKVLWYAFPNSVKITGKFGYSTSTNMPPEIAQAALITTTRWYSRGQQGFRDTGGVVELGQLTYTKALDPDVQMILDQAGLAQFPY